ncbi:MAG TPA: phenylacetate--CoA ligase PaaK [Trebonia sp.]|nr:phenylacetate--CoA ligase PaaK [Trebonia sp.]
MPKPIPADQDVEPVTRASLDELRALQLDRLRWTLSHAYANVAHYKTAFDAAGLHPDDVKDLADLAKLPFTTKETLRDNFPFGLFAVPREQVLRVHASSGTTGKPTVVGYTAGDLDTWAAVAARSMRAAGARSGDIVHIAVNYGMFTGGFGWHDGATRLGCTVIPASGGQTERQVQFIEDFKPAVIAATPTYMLTILDEMDRQGVDPRESSLNVGVFGAEPWTDKMRQSMEERADFHAVDTYGLSELIGPGVAAESFETKDGPHVWEDHFYPEVIDPDTGEVLPDGEHGELVLTSLTKEAMPVIRYRTRDLTRLLPGTAFGAMRRIEKVTGRSDDMMIVRAVNVFPTQIEEFILREPELTPHFQCHLDRQGNMDSLLVKVERRESVSAAEGAAAGRRVADRVKHLIGIRITVDVSAPHTVERSAGKMRRVVDHRENL